MADLKFLTINASNDWMSSADWAADKTHELKLYMFSSAYVGLESMISLKFKLEEASKVSKFKYHPEDAALGKAPTIYSLLGQEQEPEVDSDFDDGAKKDDDEDGEDEDGEDEDGEGTGEKKGEFDDDVEFEVPGDIQAAED
jgi:hypothetical protein